jgi:hypothetical protein
MRYLNRAVAATTGAVLALGAAPVANAAAAPDWEAPFSCGTEWSAGTRDGHSPSWYSVDFNRTDDEGAPVLATAGGQVTAVRDAGDTSYGKYVIVDHGGGFTSLYAHLQVMWVVEGQWLDQGEFIGLLGNSGGTTGPHLHFEENYERVNQHAYFHGEKLEYGTTIVARGCGDVPAVGDWNGDGRTDPGTRRRRVSSAFRQLQPDGSVAVVRLGDPTDVGVTGDWNGDGVDDVGVWSRTEQTFVLRSSRGALTEVPMGKARDVPITGDWNGDGRTEVGVYRPSTGVFRRRAADGSVSLVSFGDASSTPVTGDWNGDGRTDLGLYDRGTGTWSLRSKRRARITTVVEGGPARLPVTGDWNGDGRTDVGTWAPARARFLLRIGVGDDPKRNVLRFGRDRSN